MAFSASKCAIAFACAAAVLSLALASINCTAAADGHEPPAQCGPYTMRTTAAAASLGDDFGNESTTTYVITGNQTDLTPAAAAAEPPTGPVARLAGLAGAAAMAVAKAAGYTVLASLLLLCAVPTGGPMRQRLHVVIHAAALLWTAPLLLGYAARATLAHYGRTLLFGRAAAAAEQAGLDSSRVKSAPKTVLLTGGKMAKSLHMARALHKAGHKVVLVESHKYWCSGSRFSSAVHAFETVTCPRESGEQYLADLRAVFDRHGCDHFVPVSAPAAAVWDSKFMRGVGDGDCAALLLPPDGRPPKRRHAALSAASASAAAAVNLGFSAEVCGVLDDKHSFTEFCRSIGMGTSELLVSHRVESDADAAALNARLLREAGGRAAAARERYVLKNLSYDPLHRLDLFCLPCEPASLAAYLQKVAADGNPITAAEPWQAQRFIPEGREYTAYAVIRDSEVLAFTVSLCSPSQLRYTHVEQPQCRRWVESFCEKLRASGVAVSGQVCWDFMFGADGAAFPLECNPRVHSQSCVFASKPEAVHYADALLGRKKKLLPRSRLSPADQSEIVEPAPNDGVYIAWIQNELFYALTNLVNCLSKQFGCGGANGVFRYEVYNAGEDAHRSFADADFDAEDVLPFFMRNLAQPLVLFFNVFCSGNEWKKYDFAIGKVVEKNGD